MAYVASLQLLVTSRGKSLQDGGDPLNALNYNDFLDRAETKGYWKPRYCDWPIGGYTRKEANHRCVNGVMDTSPGSFEWNNKYDAKGHLLDIAKAREQAKADKAGSHCSARTSSSLNLCTYIQEKYHDPKKPPLDKNALVRDEMRRRFKSWSVKHFPVAPGPTRAPDAQYQEFDRWLRHAAERERRQKGDLAGEAPAHWLTKEELQALKPESPSKRAAAALTDSQGKAVARTQSTPCLLGHSFPEEGRPFKPGSYSFGGRMNTKDLSVTPLPDFEDPVHTELLKLAGGGTYLPEAETRVLKTTAALKRIAADNTRAMLSGKRPDGTLSVPNLAAGKVPRVRVTKPEQELMKKLFPAHEVQRSLSPEPLKRVAHLRPYQKPWQVGPKFEDIKREQEMLLEAEQKGLLATQISGKKKLTDKAKTVLSNNAAAAEEGEGDGEALVMDLQPPTEVELQQLSHVSSNRLQDAKKRRRRRHRRSASASEVSSAAGYSGSNVSPSTCTNSSSYYSSSSLCSTDLNNPALKGRSETANWHAQSKAV